MRARRTRRAAAAVVLVVTAGCGGTPEPSGGPVPEVWYTGCESVRRGGAGEAAWVCVRAPGKPLRLWVSRSGNERPSLTFEDRSLAVVPELLDGAAVFELADLGAGRLRAGVTGGWEISLAEAGGADDPGERTRDLLLQARSERSSEAYDLAEHHVREALRLSADAGQVSERIKAGVLLFWLERYDRGDAVAAERVLESLPDAPPGDVESAYRTAYYPATLAVNTGRFREASRYLDDALGHARRFRDERKEIFVQQMRALLMSRFGRYEEAVDLLTPLEDADALDKCRQAQLVQNVAWEEILAWEARGGPERARRAGFERVAAYEPIPRLLQALRVFSEPDCDDADERVNIRFNLALAHLHLGHLREAEEHLRAAAGSRPKAWHEAWSLDIRGRLALAGGRPEAALRSYDRLAVLARSRLSPDARWRASVGRARALSALGRRDEALKAYAEAEDLVEEEVLAVPVGVEKETSLQARAAGTREYLALLLDLGEREEALRRARRSRSRAFQGLFETHRVGALDAPRRREWLEVSERLRKLDEEEGSDWAVSEDRREETVAARRRERRELLDRVHVLLGGDLFADRRLGELQSDEVTLLYHELPEGWAGFAVLDGEITVRRIARPATWPPGDDAATSELLLAPFADVLSREEARQVRVLAPGELSTVDFHALPFEGEVLLATKPVVYGLDLGSAAAPARSAGNLLLVVDPRRNLEDAKAEGDAVAVELARVFSADRIRRLDHGAATPASFRTELADASLLHFVGHADFSGQAGWDSGLALAGDTRLTVASLLALSSVPRTVVLSACESGATAEGPMEGLGLARAFALAGAHEVVGAVRPVSDAASRAVAEELYRHWDGRGPVAEALRQAQLALWGRGAGADVRAFRVVER